MNEELPLAYAGQMRRDFSFVEDVVDACLLSATHDIAIGKAYNLSGAKASLRDLAELIIRLAGGGRLGDLTLTPEQEKIRLQDYFGSSELIYRELGWEPKVQLEDGIQMTLNYFKDHMSFYLPQIAGGQG
jgi:nucleoside-diphosphate-sugar epimerase